MKINFVIKLVILVTFLNFVIEIPKTMRELKVIKCQELNPQFSIKYKKMYLKKLYILLFLRIKKELKVMFI